MKNRGRLVSVGLVTVCALLLVGPPAGAQEGTLKKIKETGAITLGHRDASIPFSYFDDKQAAVGYAMDLCHKIVDAVKADLKMPNLQVKLNPVTSATRIPLMANGTIDLECGSTTNNPSEWVISADALSVEPYGIMLRKDDPSFKKVVDDAMTKVYKSGDINAIYAKWFLQPVPPKGINLNVPMSEVFKHVVAKPTDS